MLERQTMNILMNRRTKHREMDNKQTDGQTDMQTEETYRQMDGCPEYINTHTHTVRL
jgi:hypothetical protein